MENPFAISSWYPLLEKHTFETCIIRDVPVEFYDYLSEDGVVLSGPVPRSGFIEDESDDDDISDDQDNETIRPEDKFPLFHNEITENVSRLGGKAFIKLGSSAPKDAVWVTTCGQPVVYEPNDLYQLLKASERVSLCEDLTTRPELVLRRWADLDPSMEFRCFVKGGTIIGACQRIDTQYFSHISEHAEELKDLIDAFIRTIPCFFPENTYVCDLYVNWRRRRVMIVDFNPWSPSSTSSILFDWEFLESAFGERYSWELRFVTSEAAAMSARPKTLLGPVELENMNDFQMPPELSSFFKS